MFTKHLSKRLSRTVTLSQLPFRSLRTSVHPNDLEQFEFLSSSILPKIRRHIEENQDPSIPICNNISFDEMRSMVSHPNTLPNNPISNDALMTEIDLILRNTPRSGKSRFVDKLYSGSDSITQFATLLLSVMNNNGHTFNASQILTVIEHITINSLCQVFYNEETDGKTYGGVFMPGGAYSNCIALRLARDKYFPLAASDGIYDNQNNKKPIVLASDQSHYSIGQSASQLGFGSNNVIPLKSNANGTMDIDDCYRVVKELNGAPFILSCMAGSTVFGAFDDFAAIRAICDEYDMWMHVDGCWGGAAAFNNDDPVLSALVDGIDGADSIAFDLHKLLSTGLLCGCLLLKDESYLYQLHAHSEAKYLFHGNTYDIGLKTLQCGRQCDALKIYLNWLFYGKIGLSQRTENGMQNAQYLCKAIDASDDFILLQDPQFCNVCFWFVDPQMRDRVQKWKDNGYPKDDDIFNVLQNNTKQIQTQLKVDGSTMIDYSPAKGLPSFLRMITSNYRLDTNEIDNALTDIRSA
eukprot:179351_1